MAKSKKRPVGRPRIEIDIEQVKKLCQIQCTQDEICGLLEVDNDTLKSRLRENGYENFSHFFKTHSAGGKMSLRRNQFKMSETNAAMAIWLGKQYLGQRDMPYDGDGGSAKSYADALRDLRGPIFDDDEKKGKQ